MAEPVVPHFHNDAGVPVIEIGAKEFMCVGAKPPFDHPHVFLDMGGDNEIICPYCSTLYRHDPALDSHAARPPESALPFRQRPDPPTGALILGVRAHVIVAGAGIGGLTAALALARAGFRVAVLEQAEKLEETGAGIQLSPNATRVLIALGLGEALSAVSTVPPAMRVMAARLGPRRSRACRSRTRRTLRRALSGWCIAPTCRRPCSARPRRIPTSRSSSAPASKISPPKPEASTRAGRRGTHDVEERGVALIGADGMWSSVRQRLRADRRAALHPPYRLARAGAGRRGGARNSRRPLSSFGSGRMRIWCITRSRAAADQYRRHRARRLATRPAGPRRGERDEMLRALSARALGRRRRVTSSAADAWLKWALYDRAPLPLAAPAR